jgi:hypothetical protein
MFARHSAALMQRGVHFPPWPGMAEAAAGGVSSGNGGPLVALISPCNSGKHYTEAHGLAALRALHDEAALTVLYSHEAMALFEPERLAFLADMALSAGFITQAAYYTRNEEDHARSTFCRMAETGKAPMKTYEQWRHEFVSPNARHIADLTSVLGAENVLVRSYEAARADLFGDFCAGVLGIDRPPGDMPVVNAGAHQPTRVSHMPVRSTVVTSTACCAPSNANL